MKKLPMILTVFLVCLLTVLLPSHARSQDQWLMPPGNDYVSLEWLKASFDQNMGEYKTLNSIWFLSGKHSVSDNVSVIYDFPISKYSPKVETYYDKGESTIGNILLGLDIKTNMSKTSYGMLHLKFRLPTASEDKYNASALGVVTSYERFEAFLPNLVTYSLGGSFISKLNDFNNLKISFVGNLMNPTESSADPELFLNYSIDLTGSVEKFMYGFGFIGRYLATEQDLSFQERTVHQIGFTTGYDLGVVHPSLVLIIPADDDLSDMIGTIYGLRFIIPTK